MRAVDSASARAAAAAAVAVAVAVAAAPPGPTSTTSAAAPHNVHVVQAAVGHQRRRLRGEHPQELCDAFKRLQRCHRRVVVCLLLAVVHVCSFLIILLRGSGGTRISFPSCAMAAPPLAASRMRAGIRGPLPMQAPASLPTCCRHTSTKMYCWQLGQAASVVRANSPLCNGAAGQEVCDATLSGVAATHGRRTARQHLPR